MINKFKENFNILGITKYNRILNYLNNIEKNVKIKSEKEKILVEHITELINDRIKRLKTLYLFTNILYFGIYFSFISFFFSDFFLISEISAIVSKGVGFFGTTTLIIVLFLTNNIKELYYQDLNLLSSHLMDIYNKNIPNNKKLFDNNKYDTFIEFFKKRGF